MSNIDYPNNNSVNNTSKPNYSNQNEHDPSKVKGQRGYYGNDNNKNYYQNCNSGNNPLSKNVDPDQYPNSNHKRS